jgi:hypothetical protein
MPPGEFRWKTLPAEIREFLSDPDSTVARNQIRLFLPASSDGLVLNLVGFVTCGLFGLFMLPGSVIIFTGGIRGDFGAAGVMGVFGALFLWGAIYAWGGLRIKMARFKGRRATFGYWVLKSGILVRNHIREIIYLPWEKITSMTEAKLFSKDPESAFYSVYPALSVVIADGGKALRYHFAGQMLRSVDESKVDTNRLNLHRYDLAGKDKGEFRMFIKACSEFKPVKKS